MSWPAPPHGSAPAHNLLFHTPQAHEIGHNFNSPHTHQYCNIPDASHPDPVDRCATGCMASAGLPTCTGPVPYYNGGKGTIM